jgi:hypothetical protein
MKRTMKKGERIIELPAFALDIVRYYSTSPTSKKYLPTGTAATIRAAERNKTVGGLIFAALPESQLIVEEILMEKLKGDNRRFTR